MLPLALAAALLAPLPSNAATKMITMIDADNGEAYVPVYNPASSLVAPGTTISLRNDDLGSRSTHTVTPYFGISFTPVAVAPTGTFSFAYPGGTVLFRCEYHSSLNTATYPPACQGMCAALHDTTPDLQAPTVSITTPDGFIFTGGVRIDGTASDNAAIKTVAVTFRPVAEIPQVLPAKSQVAICTGCNGPSVKWKTHVDPGVQSRLPVLTLPPGQYRVEALATDPQGNAASAQPITIYVLT